MAETEESMRREIHEWIKEADRLRDELQKSNEEVAGRVGDIVKLADQLAAKTAQIESAELECRRLQSDAIDDQKTLMKAEGLREEMQHSRDCHYDDAEKARAEYRKLARKLEAIETLLAPLIAWTKSNTTGFGPTFTAAFVAAQAIAALAAEKE